MKRACLLLAVSAYALLATTHPTAQASPTSIYVFTALDMPAAPTEAEQERQALVDSLKKALPDNKKISAQVTVTNSRDAATLVVEVTSAEKLERVTPMLRNDVLVAPSYRASATLTFGTYSTDFLALSSQSSYTRANNLPDPRMDGPILTLLRLSSSASLTGKIHDWITSNQDDLKAKK